MVIKRLGKRLNGVHIVPERMNHASKSVNKQAGTILVLVR
jgi:hypothetical protein